MGVLSQRGESSQGSKAGDRGRAKVRGLEPHLGWEGQMEVSQARHLRTGSRGGEPGAWGDSQVTEGEGSGEGKMRQQ